MRAIWLHNYHPIDMTKVDFFGANRVYINNTDGLTDPKFIKQLKADGFEVYQWILDSLRRGRDVEPLLKNVDGFCLDGIRWKSQFAKDIPVHTVLGSLIETLPKKKIEVSVKVEGYLGNEWIFNKYAEKVWGLDYSMLTKDYGIDAICPMMYSKEYPLINFRYRAIIKWLEQYNKVQPIFYAKTQQKSMEESWSFANSSVFGWNV